MRVRLTIQFLALMCTLPNPVLSARGQDLSRMLETVVDASELTEEEFEAIEADRLECIKNPLSLNSTEERDLNALPGLTRQEVAAILSFRSDNGTISSLEELISIPELSDQALQILRRCSVPAMDEKRVSKPESSANRPWVRIGINLKRRSDSEDPPIRGGYSSFRRSVKITAGTPYWSARLTLRNDPHEQHVWNVRKFQYGFDSVTGYVAWQNKTGSTKAVVGNLTLDVGQGLILAHPFGTRMSLDAPHHLIKAGSGLRGYSGSSSASALRGVGLQTNLIGPFEMLLYGSYKRLDGRIELDPETGEEVGVPIQSGVHVSDAQLQQRAALRTNSSGIVLWWQWKGLQLGAQYSRIGFYQSLRLSEGRHSVRNLVRHSFFAEYESRSAKLEVELLPQRNGPFSVSVGGLWRPARSIRYFLKGYQYRVAQLSYFANPYSSKKSFEFQKGFAAGIWVRPARNWKITSTFEWSVGSVTHPAPQFPARASRLRVYLEHEFTGSRFQLSLDARRTPTHTPQRLTNGTELRASGSEMNRSVTIQYLSAVAEAVYLITRFDLNVAEKGILQRDAGIHVGQQISWSPFPSLELIGIEHFFAVPQSTPNIYVYEPDVAGDLSVPVLSDWGSRSALVVRCQLGGAVSIQTKWVRMRQEKIRDKSAGRPFAPRLTSQLTFQLQIDA